ncbi:MAG: glycosyltransferase family 39 protein [Candidatus Kerfeldbacteria bacterium]|nr:glycosyltransferase family 39 protein [Candidatus Kerfeldbacteria bacterium]
MLNVSPNLDGKFYLRKVLLVTIPLLATVGVFWKFFIVAEVPFRLDYAEGFIFTNSLSILQGESIYQNIVSGPYIFGFYTPLFNYVSAVLMKLFGSDISVLRTLSFIFFLGSGVSVGYIVKKYTHSLFASLFAALLFLSAFVISQWSSVARPDMFGLFLICLGLATTVVPWRINFLRIVIPSVIFALAFFTKQNFVFAPLAYSIYLGLNSNKKNLLSFAGIYASCLTLGILLLHYWTKGEFTKQVFVYTGLVSYGNLYTAFRIVAITAITATPFIIASVKRIISKPKNLLSIYVVCSALTGLMLLRDGGIQNYLIEFILAVVLAACTTVPWDTLQRAPAAHVYPLLFVLQFFFVLWSYSAMPWDVQTYATERLNIFNQEVSTIRRSSRILVEDPLVAHATASKIELDPYTYGQITESGLLSNTQLFSEIKNGQFQYLDDYGAFDRINGMLAIKSEYFYPELLLKFSNPIKPFDYSLYNKHVVSEIGTLYHFGVSD